MMLRRQRLEEKLYLKFGKNMSRLGKKPINIPEGVSATFTDGILNVKGPKGELNRNINPLVSLEIKDGAINLSVKKDTLSTIWGTVSSHVLNMVHGITKGFEKKLILEGVGYKADVKGDSLVCALGFSHPVNIPIPKGLNVKSEKGSITISGIDKELVGSFAAKVRDNKKPEPYKGKGFRYDTEIIERKQGKKTV
jgi:large subunit ribosomal protein L6